MGAYRLGLITCTNLLNFVGFNGPHLVLCGSATAADHIPSSSSSLTTVSVSPISQLVFLSLNLIQFVFFFFVFLFPLASFHDYTKSYDCFWDDEDDQCNSLTLFSSDSYFLGNQQGSVLISMSCALMNVNYCSASITFKNSQN